MKEAGRPEGNAVHVLGCPEVPVQTSIALYAMHLLRKKGVRNIVAGTKAARTLLDIADMERHYLDEIVDIDEYIGMLAEGRIDFTYSFVYIHNDAGISYAATVSTLTKGRTYAIVFGAHALERAAEIDFPCTVIAARATHNPLPLKMKLDRALEEESHGVH